MAEARAWFERDGMQSGVSFDQFLIDNECIVRTQPQCIARIAGKNTPELQNAIADSVRYPAAASAHVLDERHALALRIETNHGKTGTAVERQQLHVYAMVTERFGVDGEAGIDEAFFNYPYLLKCRSSSGGTNQNPLRGEIARAECIPIECFVNFPQYGRHNPPSRK